MIAMDIFKSLVLIIIFWKEINNKLLTIISKWSQQYSYRRGMILFKLIDFLLSWI